MNIESPYGKVAAKEKVARAALNGDNDECR